MGKLNYLTITRPNIAFVISVVNSFISAPRSMRSTVHLEGGYLEKCEISQGVAPRSWRSSGHLEVAAFRSVRYLKAHSGRGLFYGVHNHLHIKAFSDCGSIR